MATTIGERIRDVRMKKGLTQLELANALKTTKQNVYKYEVGIVTNIPSDKIEQIAKILDVSPSYLMGWEKIDNLVRGDDTEFDSNSVLYEKFSNIKPVQKVKVPMIGYVACGEPIFAEADHEAYIEIDGNMNVDFCLTCAGDSMEPKLLNGDVVFVRKQEAVYNGEIGVVIIDDDTATLKRVYYDRTNNIVTLVAENPKYQPLVYSGEQLNHIRILGKAISLYRHI